MVGCLPGTCKTPEKTAVLPSNKEKTKLEPTQLLSQFFKQLPPVSIEDGFQTFPEYHGFYPQHCKN